MDTRRETSGVTTDEEAMKGRPGHPEESPKGFAKFVIIAAVIVIIGMIWFFLA
jgi:hypothetical protein